jgi:hypothetical protein
MFIQIIFFINIKIVLPSPHYFQSYFSHYILPFMSDIQKLSQLQFWEYRINFYW